MLTKKTTDSAEDTSSTMSVLPESSHASDLASLTSVESVDVSPEKLSHNVTKLELAHEYLNPVINEIVAGAARHTRSELSQLLNGKQPICSISYCQYVRAFNASKIVEEVRQDVGGNAYQRGEECVLRVTEYSRPYRTGTAGERIYIDRDLMKQLVDLHEMISDTIGRLRTSIEELCDSPAARTVPLSRADEEERRQRVQRLEDEFIIIDTTGGRPKEERSKQYVEFAPQPKYIAEEEPIRTVVTSDEESEPPSDPDRAYETTTDAEATATSVERPYVFGKCHGELVRLRLMFDEISRTLNDMADDKTDGESALCDRISEASRTQLEILHCIKELQQIKSVIKEIDSVQPWSDIVESNCSAASDVPHIHAKINGIPVAIRVNEEILRSLSTAEEPPVTDMPPPKRCDCRPKDGVQLTYDPHMSADCPVMRQIKVMKSTSTTAVRQYSSGTSADDGTVFRQTVVRETVDKPIQPACNKVVRETVDKPIQPACDSIVRETVDKPDKVVRYTVDKSVQPVDDKVVRQSVDRAIQPEPDKVVRCSKEKPVQPAADKVDKPLQPVVRYTVDESVQPASDKVVRYTVDKSVQPAADKVVVETVDGPAVQVVDKPVQQVDEKPVQQVVEKPVQQVVVRETVGKTGKVDKAVQVDEAELDPRRGIVREIAVYSAQPVVEKADKATQTDKEEPLITKPKGRLSGSSGRPRQSRLSFRKDEPVQIQEEKRKSGPQSAAVQTTSKPVVQAQEQSQPQNAAVQTPVSTEVRTPSREAAAQSAATVNRESKVQANAVPQRTAREITVRPPQPTAEISVRKSGPTSVEQRPQQFIGTKSALDKEVAPRPMRSSFKREDPEQFTAFVPQRPLRDSVALRRSQQSKSTQEGVGILRTSAVESKMSATEPPLVCGPKARKLSVTASGRYAMSDAYTTCSREAVVQYSERVVDPLLTRPSDGFLPYPVHRKSLPNVDVCPPKNVDLITLKSYMRPDGGRSRRLGYVDAESLIGASLPAECCRNAVINERDADRRPFRASLDSLPLCTSELDLIDERTAASQYVKSTFEYYTNFQANFASNVEYFAPLVYEVRFFEMFTARRLGERLLRKFGGRRDDVKEDKERRRKHRRHRKRGKRKLRNRRVQTEECGSEVFYAPSTGSLPKGAPVRRSEGVQCRMADEPMGDNTSLSPKNYAQTLSAIYGLDDDGVLRPKMHLRPGEGEPLQDGFLHKTFSMSKSQLNASQNDHIATDRKPGEAELTGSVLRFLTSDAAVKAFEKSNVDVRKFWHNYFDSKPSASGSSGNRRKGRKVVPRKGLRKRHKKHSSSASTSDVSQKRRRNVPQRLTDLKKADVTESIIEREDPVDSYKDSLKSLEQLASKNGPGYISVLHPICGCPEVSIFIPCYCDEHGGGLTRSDLSAKQIDSLLSGSDGRHIVLPRSCRINGPADSEKNSTPP